MLSENIKGTKMKKFAIFVLTHGRGETMTTDVALRGCGYKGKIYYVIDNTDKQKDAYERRCYDGDEVLVFDKEKTAGETDYGDNSGNRAAVIFARNAVYELAREKGVEAFAMMDDDITGFSYRVTNEGRSAGQERRLCDFDSYCEIMAKFLRSTGFVFVGMSHGGDWIGGIESRAVRRFWREGASNVFFCLTEKAVRWKGGANEDMATGLVENCRGNVAISILPVMCKEKVFSGASGGMTPLYEKISRYVQLFVPILYCPTAIRLTIGAGGKVTQRLIRDRIMPKIIKYI